MDIFRYDPLGKSVADNAASKMGQAEGRPYEMAHGDNSITVLLFSPWAISYGRPSACPILLAALSATPLPSGSYRKMSLYKIFGLWPQESVSNVLLW